MVYAIHSLRQGEISCRRIGRYENPEQWPLPQFFEMCREVRAYQAADELRYMSGMADVIGSMLSEAGSRGLGKMLSGLNDVRTAPLDAIN